MEAEFAKVGRNDLRGVVVICFFLLAFRAEVAASPMPHQLYGKSVLVSAAGAQTYTDETTGEVLTTKYELTTTFYFSTQGRVFARYSFRNPHASRTWEQVGADPNKAQPPATNSTATVGTGAHTYQNIRFDGHKLIAVQKVGENGARTSIVEFNADFSSCTYKLSLSPTSGIRSRAPNGHVERTVSDQIAPTACVVREGNSLGN